MTQGQRLKVLAAAMSFAGVALAVMLIRSPGVQAQDNPGNEEGALVRIGFEIAPVPLNMEGKNHTLVGLGSFIVNGQADCNGCHTAGVPPNLNYAPGGNPYFGQKAVVDPTVYLSGGNNFGPVGTPTGPLGYAGPNMITRNLTPDKNGRPEGGHTLAEFKQILRIGTDFDHIHPICTAAQLAQIEATTDPTAQLPVCIPATMGNSVDGDLLQIMPWPVYHNMTDHQIEAIYEYLSAIPCIDNTTSTPPAGAPDELRNDCGGGDPKPGSQNAPSLARRRAKP
jgi:hypothetical protein